MKKRSIAILSIFTAINLGGMLFVVFAASPSTPIASGTITVAAPPGLAITAASMNGQACTLGSTITCPNTSFPNGPGTSEVLSVTVNNPAGIAQSISKPTWTFTSTGTNTSAILNIAPINTYPVTVNAGSNTSPNLTFNVIAESQGSDSFTLTV